MNDNRKKKTIKSKKSKKGKKTRSKRQKGSSGTAPRETGTSYTLFDAIKERNNDKIEILIRNNININIQDEYGWTPLMWAIYLGSQNTIELLLNKNGINLHARDIHGKTVLMIACAYSFPSTVSRLLLKGSAVNDVDINNKNALFIACERGMTSIVNILLQNGADPNIHESEEGSTPLMIACLLEYRDIVSFLLTRNTDIDATDLVSNTALMIACHTGNLDIVISLIASGANVNLTDDQGFTALDNAIIGENIEVVNLLVMNRAIASGRNVYGETTYQWARRTGLTDIADLIQQNIQDRNLRIAKLVTMKGKTKDDKLLFSSLPKNVPQKVAEYLGGKRKKPNKRK